jgi:hypothetical protein
MIRSFSTVVAMLTLAAPLAAQRGSSGAFLVMLGRDTISAEQYTRIGNTIQGTYIVRTPQIGKGVYTATLAPDGSLGHLDLVRYAGVAPDAKVIRRTVAGPHADSMVVELTTNGKTTRMPAQKLPAQTLPLFGGSYALEELIAQRFTALRKDSATLNIAFVGSPAAEIPVKRIAADSIVIMLPNDDQHLRVDREGRMLGMRSPNSTVKVEVVRIPSIDLKAYAAAWSSRPLGQLSPTDSVSGAVGSAHVNIVYSRPLKRGRQIFGGIVPWGQVWRTGANAATMFTSDKDLDIGGKTVPAGTYTLWSIPTPDGWSLIVNTQTRQWGTDYHADSDFAKIPMTLARQTPPVEEFTISLEPQGETKSLLKLAWDDRVATVPVKVKE